MSRITELKDEVDYVGERLHRLRKRQMEPDVTHAILKLKDLTLDEVERVTTAAVKGGASQKEVDRLAVFAIVCKFLLIQRTFEEGSSSKERVATNQKQGRETVVKEVKLRNAKMAAQYRKRKPTVGCLNARRELREKHGLTLQQVTKALRSEGIEIK